MKALSLYINRWYIVAAFSSDNISYRINSSNNEDRFWLYFYEDLNNDQIIYGKEYKQHFLDRKLHYYGDIFSIIPKDNETFSRFGIDINIKEIFKASGILDDLKKDFPGEKNIETYISFSVDVSYAAQKVFLDILKDNGFDVKESVVRLSNLALEYSSKKGDINEFTNNILVISACNENLRYVLYKKSKDIFVRQSKEGLLSGYGTDLRARALIEQIIRQINSNARILQKDEEHLEIIRLEQNIQQKLDRLDNVTNGKPVVYNDIIFSRAPHNVYSVIIQKREIEERTNAIVNRVIDNIIQYINDNSIDLDSISNVVFIGDPFKNKIFREAILRENIIRDDNNIITYYDKDISDILNIYSQIDLSQFDSLRDDIKNLSIEEIEQIKLAEKEREEIERATKAQIEREQAKDELRKAEEKFEAILNEVRDYEKREDYSSMIDLLKIALALKPENKEAKDLLDYSSKKFSEQNVRSEQYNKTIKYAQDAFKEKRWQDALSKSQQALELRPNSIEAQRIRSEAKRIIKLEESIKEFLLKADTFIGQKMYSEALVELNKAKLADANNQDILTRIKKIEEIQKKNKLEIENLIRLLQEAKEKQDFEKAIEHCNALLEKDTGNYRKWHEELSAIQSEQKHFNETKTIWNNLTEKINSAYFNENWESVIRLTKEALNIKEDDKIRSLLQKAQSKYKEIKDKEIFDKQVYYIKSIIADRRFAEAKSLAKKLKDNYPNRSDDIKKLFTLIFTTEEDLKQPIPEAGPIGPIDGDFFCDDFGNKTQPYNENDNFFDTNTKSSNQNSKKISNNDFDF